ncbi:tetratricopeptide repeat protein [Gaetbulibacter sp. M235]|uniref:ATP-binding protein n=1 Tax=Gaetbulibacter sp. M235 TaxID=3126510 RepID=UPI00374FB3AB
MNIKSPFLILLICSLAFLSVHAQSKLEADSLQTYLLKSKDGDKYSNEDRLTYILKAKQIVLSNRIDSLIIKVNLQLSSIYYENRQLILFKKINDENLKVASKIKDSSALAEINFNLGDYYKLFNKSDSAYYYYHKTEKLFKSLKDDYNTTMVLLNIAVLQKNEKDFIGSEVTSVEAISHLNQLEEINSVIKLKSYIYNNLGLVFDQLEQYDESIKYHKKAIELKKRLEGDNQATIENSLNNLALAYKSARQYKLALENYNQILQNKDLVKSRPDVYATILDNYANTLYLSKNYNELPGLYLKALKICDSIGASYNSIIINQHLAQYYDDYNKKDSAKYYAYRAKDISKAYHNDDLLKSLLLLSKIEDDSIAVKYYNEYIKLNDSLVKNERTIRNKFARIRFETKEIEQKNIQIVREKLWLTVISIILLISALLIYIIITQRAKNNELKFVQKQQEANEEIYNLMLTQQEKIEEARILEKKNISQELHDGVLGRLFGTRLSLDSLNMASSEEAIKTRSRYIQDLKNIENDIRKVSHELNTDFISGSGFLDIVKSLLETQTKAYELDYEFDCKDSINWDDVSNKNKIHMYRIIQESLHNIYKHAKASLIKISIELKNNVILLSINDNGSGFDVNKAKAGIGLKNMNSRVNEINGELSIESKKDEGTMVQIKIPT